MKFNKFEVVGAALSVGLIAVAIYLVQLRDFGVTEEQPAAALANTQALRVVSDQQMRPQTQTEEVEESETNEISTMKIDDIKIGVGAAAQNGDKVAVHYIGTLQDGTEFDNSHKRGAPIEFTIGAGQVIAGWEEGITGMQVGGERTLVIPPEKAYGDRGIGPIPGGATLVFAVELVSINE